ncbi:MAG: hypothetical protein FWD77_09680 [Betaproteobacteria bacterium]|nr:hypothetical protein [Betaproteobacteria bacterium]
MPEAFNPYTPPTADILRTAQPGADCWRDGKTLMLRQDAAFPDRCAQCGAPASPPARPYRLRWFPRWISIAGILLCLLWFAAMLIPALWWDMRRSSLFLSLSQALVLASLAWAGAGIIFRRRFTVLVPFCARHQRRWRIYHGCAAVLAAALILMIGILLVGRSLWNFSWVLPALWIILIALVFLTRLRPVFSARKADREYLWIKGCGKDFLASLPEAERE